MRTRFSIFLSALIRLLVVSLIAVAAHDAVDSSSATSGPTASQVLRAVAALSAPAGSICDPSDTQDSIPTPRATKSGLSLVGERRCVAGRVFNTRGRLQAHCVVGAAALAKTRYTRNECSAAADADQIEAIAQERAIAKFNLHNGQEGVGDRPGVTSSATGDASHGSV